MHSCCMQLGQSLLTDLASSVALLPRFCGSSATVHDMTRPFPLQGNAVRTSWPGDRAARFVLELQNKPVYLVLPPASAARR